MKPARKWLWITDPWSTLDHPNDTTLRLAEAAIQLGVESHWCDFKSIRVCPDGAVRLDSHKLKFPALRSPTSKSASFQIKAFDQIHYRVDPPVDLSYLHPLQMLRIADQSYSKQRRPEFVNPLSLLMNASEKLEAHLLPKRWRPAMVVSSQQTTLLEFGRAEKIVVLKPMHTAQSKGVTRLEFRTPAQIRKSLAALDAITFGFQQPVVLQRYLPGIRKTGEVRIWFADGVAVASVLKIPSPDTFRIDMDHGSTLASVRTAPPQFRRLVANASQAIGRLLRKIGARLAAVDLIDGRVTDFNITSPGLLVGMEKTLETNLASRVVEILLSRRR